MVLLKSFGATYTILEYLIQLQRIKTQQLCKRAYKTTIPNTLHFTTSVYHRFTTKDSLLYFRTIENDHAYLCIYDMKRKLKEKIEIPKFSHTFLLYSLCVLTFDKRYFAILWDGKDQKFYELDFEKGEYIPKSPALNLHAYNNKLIELRDNVIVNISCFSQKQAKHKMISAEIYCVLSDKWYSSPTIKLANEKVALLSTFAFNNACIYIVIGRARSSAPPKFYKITVPFKLSSTTIEKVDIHTPNSLTSYKNTLFTPLIINRHTCILLTSENNKQLVFNRDTNEIVYENRINVNFKIHGMSVCDKVIYDRKWNKLYYFNAENKLIEGKIEEDRVNFKYWEDAKYKCIIF